MNGTWTSWPWGRRSLRPGGWDTWLVAAFVAVTVGGVVLVLAPDLVVLAPLNAGVVRAFFGAPPPVGAESLRRWLYAVEGSTLVAFGVLGVALARTAFRRRERWARDAMALAVGVWFPLDTAASLLHGVWENAALNGVIALVLLAPVLATWTEFGPDAPGATVPGGGPWTTGRRPTTRSSPRDVAVAWEPPYPRPGWRGSLDRFVGPGATPAEILLQVASVGAIGGAALAASASAPGLRALSPLAWIVLVVLALDVAGGIVTNATAPAKRWYHRPELGFGQQLGFVAAHGVHLLLFTAVLHGMGWGDLALFSALLLGVAALLLSAPLYLQRPLALGCYALLLLLSIQTVPPGSGLAWFLPLFFLKLVVSHLVREAPFRPTPGALEGRPRTRRPGSRLPAAPARIPPFLLLTIVLALPGVTAAPVSAQSVAPRSPVAPAATARPDAPEAGEGSRLVGFWAFRWSRLYEDGCRLAGAGFGLRLGRRSRVSLAGYGTAGSSRYGETEFSISYGGARLDREVLRRGRWSASAGLLVGGGSFRIEHRPTGSEEHTGVALLEPELRVGADLGQLSLSGGVAYRWVRGVEDLENRSNGDASDWALVLQLSVG